MIARYAASVAAGLIVTFGLLYGMQLMIETGREVVTDPKLIRLADFVRVERTAVVETRERKLERPPEPERRPEAPRPDLDTDSVGALAVSVTAPAFDIGLKVGSGLTGISDGEYLPIVKVAPVYPTRALARRLEGFVMVEFTVTTAGAVKDVVVLESTAEIFEKAAIEAALKFKYKPRIIDGAPVEVLGVLNKIVFTMDASQQLAMER